MAEDDLLVDNAQQEEKSYTTTFMKELFMRSTNMEEDMADDRHLWRLGMDRRLLAV